LDLQNRSAVAVAAFIEFCVESNIVQPPDKIVKNLCTFLCQDIDQTPTFAYLRKITDGILSFRGSNSTSQDNSGINGVDRTNPEKSQDVVDKARIARRGACQAFDQLSTRFGSRLLDVIPSMWQSMAGGLLSACQAGRRFVKFYQRTSFDSFTDSPQQSDLLIERQHGQDVVDSLSVLAAVIPTFHEDIWPKLHQIFPMMHLALSSKFAIIRQAAAQCFATVCDVMTSEAMRYVIEKIIPLLQDPLVLANRQGATELIYRQPSRFSARVDLSDSTDMIQTSSIV